MFWRGKGLKEQAVNEKEKIIIKVSKIYFKSLEVDFLKGNITKARKKLKWKPKINLDQLINEIIEYEKKLSINS
ncbi:GDP-mannose 4,6-dehydratase [Candidatus Pelagibacter ubique]|nr:GDP-mannose 4,6-dehydratase [Candidatus Pelagibacter ubique]